MDMKVQIISTETIKPSSPTPKHLRTYNFSLFDQLAPPVYVPIILFYSAAGENSSKRSDHLKESLSNTLTHFYPFAGRVKDGFSIDCNDHGATYVEANVSSDMSLVLKQPDIDVLQQLLPCNPLEKLPESSSQVILAVQVNHFNCGGMAICVCIRHVIADASAAATFVKSWAAVASGAAHDDGVIFDCTSVFPPQDLSSFWKSLYKNRDFLTKVVTKRFLFDGSRIAGLRDKIGNGDFLDHPTRVEAVSALIWGAFIAAAKERDETIPMHVATTAVNLRKRMNPPMPQHSIGNIYQVTMANWQMERTINYNGLASKIHESIRKMNDDYVRKLHSVNGYTNLMKKGADELGKSSKIVSFGFSSWCKFPFYEANFGWGKPIWFSTALKLSKVAVFMDTSDGEGIEALVGLSKEDMAEFEQNPDILAYASVNPSISVTTLI